MAEPEPFEVDLSPAHLLRWLQDEIERTGAPGLSVRATREWSVEPVAPADGGGLDPEDELAAHTAVGTLELAARNGGWRLTMEVIDQLGGGTAPDWPPTDAEPEGPEEVSLAAFAETFAVDGLDGSFSLAAASASERRKAERVIARILADTHRR